MAEPRPVPSFDAEAQLVLRQIERAFAKIQLGKGVSLRETEVIDDYGSDEDRKRARAKDELDDWRRIPDDDLAEHHGLTFFDPEGLAFHLPAYMRFVLRNFRTSDSVSILFTLFALGRPADYLEELTTKQKAAVDRFLEYMSVHGGPDYGDYAVEARGALMKAEERKLEG